MHTPKHLGIDFGSKLAGTTAAAMVQDKALKVWQSHRGQDADKWLLELITELQPGEIFIDAPLTLPGIYTQGVYTSDAEYFYRACDREVQAMSPMFIGGLTARAIRLRATLAENGRAVLETYPSQLAKLIFPQHSGYKKGLTALSVYTETLQDLLPFPIAEAPTNWHQFDSLLAWYSGYRHLQGQAQLYGDPREGRIIV
ncbi:hypothetical protein ACFSRY_16825 [Pontibacter locisalis]|uniref:DUF429 domain-containing protein n=1 Tax=Pontibacter locisalis TaxID=1719035 RepID=A0ABW5IS17_9BACT